MGIKVWRAGTQVLGVQLVPTGLMGVQGVFRPLPLSEPHPGLCLPIPTGLHVGWGSPRCHTWPSHLGLSLRVCRASPLAYWS